MEATKDHISLETAKLLKNCGVKNHICFSQKGDIKDCVSIKYNGILLSTPAYTWQEILWEYPEKFFRYDYKGRIDSTNPHYILWLLCQKNYKEADLYFREKCILIKD